MNEKEIRKEISIRFKKMRETLDYSQEKMGFHLGIARPSYAKYERGDTFPNLVGLTVLADKFGLSLDWLITGRGAMFYEGKAGQAEREEEVSDETKELIDAIKSFPVLRYRFLSQFYQYKQQGEFSDREPES